MQCVLITGVPDRSQNSSGWTWNCALLHSMGGKVLLMSQISISARGQSQLSSCQSQRWEFRSGRNDLIGVFGKLKLR